MEPNMETDTQRDAATDQPRAKPCGPSAASRTICPQPAWAVQHDDALLKLPLVTALTGLSSSSIYRKVAAGLFPPPVRLGARCSRWKAGCVNYWLRQQAGGAQ
jgi:prophage regulatory protein